MMRMGPDPDELTICHANADGSWSEITVDENALNGHEIHDDDIWPPYDGITEGSNWPEGQEIFFNGCKELPVTGGFDVLLLIIAIMAIGAGVWLATVGRK